MNLSFSFVIPVYNRPGELRELLHSLAQLEYNKPFEVVVVEDGSEQAADAVADDFKEMLSLMYLRKENTGPGDSRNYGMARASGNYYIILDSDCLVPKHYLNAVESSLNKDYVDCFGGPDAAHRSFTKTQKAINYAMTSLLTTGGIRGRKNTVSKFQPRSFNMGISKKAFQLTGGYGKIHPGEDPDLSIRLWAKGFSTKLIPDAYVYHKRRVDLQKFFSQVKKFGMVRPILNHWHPQSSKITYWFPTLFSLGLLIAIVVFIFNYKIPLLIYGAYYSLVFLEALFKTWNPLIALMALVTTTVQFLGYGYGFLKSTILVNFTRRTPQELFPELFF